MASHFIGCAACDEMIPHSEYTKGQLAKGTDRRCKTCVKMQVPVPPAVEARAAAHAARLGLPRITKANAESYPAPNLNQFRTVAARASDDAAPVLWFWQMTGTD